MLTTAILVANQSSLKDLLSNYADRSSVCKVKC